MSSREEQAPEERLAWVGLLPVAATALFYVLPESLRRLTAVQFIPQMSAYLGLVLWSRGNTSPWHRLGLVPVEIPRAIRWGLPVGLVLGLVNVSVMLWVVPGLGGDIQFLRDTPHARLPVWFMLPWFIVVIAFLVELNFRGFLLGRLLTLLARLPPGLAAGTAVLFSALVFSFDPFMTATFRHLHWMAAWDGIVWGLLWVGLRKLSIPIVAHAVEVIVMYATLKAVLS